MKLRKKAAMVGGAVLRPDDAVGDALRAAAREIIAAADRALTDPATADAEAVHEIRKALKRWRALLRMLGDILGGQGEQLRGEARELMRALAGARDAQCAIDALADLQKTGIPLSQASIATIEGRLQELRRAAETTAMTAGIRERLHRYLDFAILSVDRWPLDKVAFGAVAEGLAFTYRRARNLIPKSWPDAEPAELHDLRRRVVEHRHQMDLIEPLWPRLGQAWAAEAQRLRNRLGACQDLHVFAGLTAPNRPLAPWRSRLAPAAALRRAAHVAASARLAGRLFAERPKAFRRRIEAMWQRGADAIETRAGIDAAVAAAPAEKPRRAKAPRSKKTAGASQSKTAKLKARALGHAKKRTRSKKTVWPRRKLPVSRTGMRANKRVPAGKPPRMRSALRPARPRRRVRPARARRARTLRRPSRR